MSAPLMALLALVRARAEEELVLAEGSLAYEIMFTGLRHRLVSCVLLDPLRRPPWIALPWTPSGGPLRQTLIHPPLDPPGGQPHLLSLLSASGRWSVPSQFSPD